MTVKSPFYNKPSTATSVDSCHKCPLDTITQSQDSSVVPIASSVKKVQSNTGFEYTQATDHSSNSNINTTSNQQPSAVEPSSSSAATSDIGNASMTSCSNCGTTTTPLWRRSPQGETICNACGLYLKARNTTRPPWLKRNNIKRPTPSAPVALAPAPPTSISMTTTTPIAATATTATTAACIPRLASSQQHQQPAKDGEERPALSCANCNTTSTPLWRRDEQGNTICNACGLYYKLHSVHRPMTMKRSIIKRRKRVTVSSMAAQHHYSSASSDDGNSSGDDSSTTSQQQQQQQQSATLAPRKRKLMPNNDIHRNKRIELCGNGNTKYVMRPLLPNQPLAPATSATTAETSRLDPVEPDAFHKHHHQQHQHLPSPPMKPMPRLLNPESRSLPSLHSLPSPPLTAKEMFKDQGASSSAVTTAAAMATVSALLNPTQKTHQMLEAHRHELQREVTNLTSLLSRTTAMLQNLDQVMAVTKDKQPATTNSTQQQPHVTNALMSLFALAAAKETSGSSA